MNGAKSEKPAGLRKLDLVVAGRMILSLYRDGMEKRTNIARNSKTSYDKCVRYLDALETMGFVQKKTVDGFKMFGLTESGVRYARKLVEETDK